jgi:Na+-driven multidrug efflux pump
MDVAGVALATIISQYISAISVLFLLTHDEADYKLSIKSLKIKGNILSQILQYGLPIGIQSSLFSFSNVLIQSSINTFGSTVVAGNSAAQSIEGFVWQAANSASQAAMTFTGQNFGARKFERVKTVLIECCGLAVSVVLIFGGIVVLFKEPLLSIYTDSPNVITAGSNRIVIICLFYFLGGIMDTVSNVSRGMGKSIVPMIITLICVCAIRIVWLYTVFPIFRSPATVYWSYPITWALAIFFQLIYFIIVYRRFTKTK